MIMYIVKHSQAVPLSGYVASEQGSSLQGGICTGIGVISHRSAAGNSHEESFRTLTLVNET